jgi:hypothetical protein
VAAVLWSKQMVKLGLDYREKSTISSDKDMFLDKTEM